MTFPAVTAVANVLAHAPGLVRYGSKPLRDIAHAPSALEAIAARLRSYEDAVAYGPNQAFIGNIEPEALASVSRPWFDALDRSASSTGAFGDLISEGELLGLLKLCDRARLVQLDATTLNDAGARLVERGIVTPAEMDVLMAADASAIDALCRKIGRAHV